MGQINRIGAKFDRTSFHIVDKVTSINIGCRIDRRLHILKCWWCLIRLINVDHFIWAWYTVNIGRHLNSMIRWIIVHNRRHVWRLCQTMFENTFQWSQLMLIVGFNGIMDKIDGRGIGMLVIHCFWFNATILKCRQWITSVKFIVYSRISFGTNLASCNRQCAALAGSIVVGAQQWSSIAAWSRGRWYQQFRLILGGFNERTMEQRNQMMSLDYCQFL